MELDGQSPQLWKQKVLCEDAEERTCETNRWTFATLQSREGKSSDGLNHGLAKCKRLQEHRGVSHRPKMLVFGRLRKTPPHECSSSSKGTSHSFQY